MEDGERLGDLWRQGPRAARRKWYADTAVIPTKK
jgi:hypothetical protein